MFTEGLPLILSTSRACLLALLLTVLAACGGAPTDQPLPDAAQTLQTAAEQIQTATTLRFKLQLTGAPAYVDYNNTIAFLTANGAYVEPDRVQAKVTAKLIGIPGEVDIVAIGDEQYMKSAVLTANRWLVQQFSPGFNAQKLIKSDTGIEAAIRSIRNVKMVGREKLFGTDVYHLTGEATATDIASLTVDLIRGTGTVVVDAYINTGTGRVDQVILTQPETKTDELDATKWTLELFDYNARDVTIDKPADAQQPAGGTLPQVGGPGVPTSAAPAVTNSATASATESVPTGSAVP